jgi:hypothetical protein
MRRRDPGTRSIDAVVSTSASNRVKTALPAAEHTGIHYRKITGADGLRPDGHLRRARKMNEPLNLNHETTRKLTLQTPRPAIGLRCPWRISLVNTLAFLRLTSAALGPGGARLQGHRLSFLTVAMTRTTCWFPAAAICGNYDAGRVAGLLAAGLFPAPRQKDGIHPSAQPLAGLSTQANWLLSATSARSSSDRHSRSIPQSAGAGSAAVVLALRPADPVAKFRGGQAVRQRLGRTSGRAVERFL